jgi:hypothetical protein
MNSCYSKIIPKSVIRKELLDFCENSGDWVDPAVGTFFQKKPSKELIFKDPFLKHICENCISLEYGFEECVSVYLIKSWTHYMIHTDRFRSSSINLLVNDHTDSISYFQVSEPYNKLHIRIEELKYEADRYYLFNSKIPHAVTNRTPDRYLLSITLKDNYDNMFEYLKNQLFL